MDRKGKKKLIWTASKIDIKGSSFKVLKANIADPSPAGLLGDVDKSECKKSRTDITKFSQEKLCKNNEDAIDSPSSKNAVNANQTRPQIEATNPMQAEFRSDGNSSRWDKSKSRISSSIWTKLRMKVVEPKWRGSKTGSGDPTRPKPQININRASLAKLLEDEAEPHFTKSDANRTLSSCVGLCGSMNESRVAASKIDKEKLRHDMPKTKEVKSKRLWDCAGEREPTCAESKIERRLSSHANDRSKREESIRAKSNRKGEEPGQETPTGDKKRLGRTELCASITSSGFKKSKVNSRVSR